MAMWDVVAGCKRVEIELCTLERIRLRDVPSG
jgi:hypothetical protein